jgi:glycosyltransferase involved in cell wall biosynthesis
MKVGCNLLWLVPGAVGGSETATVGVLRQFAAEPPADLDLSLYTLEGFAEAYPDLAGAFPTEAVPLQGRLKPLRVAAENTWLPRRTRDRVDLMHHMGGVLPPTERLPSVLTLHDLQPFDLPDNFHTGKRIYLQQTIPRSVRRARVVLTASEFVRRGVIERFGADPDRVRVARFGMEPPSTDVSVAQVQARYRLPRRWFVFPSFTWWHKDHALLVQAFAQVAAHNHDVVLVLTGGAGPAEPVLADVIARLGLRDRVRRTGLIPRPDVLAIVRGAVAMTYPSRYEGFGLPALEAMSLGTPVLAADATSLPELVGGAGLLLPPGDADAWARAMTAMLGDEDERRRMSEAGRTQVADLTWQATADASLAAYHAALDGSAGEGKLDDAAAGEAAPDEPAAKDAATDQPATDDDGVAS